MTLKEEMIYSSNYIAGNESQLLNEENKVICESIKNSSVSKFLDKQAKKIYSEALKLKEDNRKEEYNKAKELSETFKKAANDIRETELNYKSGDPLAKKEYKKLCKKYSNLLKEKGIFAKTLAGIAGVIASIVLLGNLGLTALANDDIFERIKEGIKEGNLPEVLKTMRIKNIGAVMTLVNKNIKQWINFS